MFNKDFNFNNNHIKKDFEHSLRKIINELYSNFI